MPQFIKLFKEAADLGLCQKIMTKFDQDTRVQADPQPDYSGRHFLVTKDLGDWGGINKQINQLVHRYTQKYFKYPKSLATVQPSGWAHDGFVVARYRPGDTCTMHVDGVSLGPTQNYVRLATFLLYLNTVEEGGETFFPFQETKIAPVAGSVAIFPPGLTHPHEVKAASSDRYILQTWIIDPNLRVISQSDYSNSLPLRS